MIQRERMRAPNHETNGYSEYVLYWMQASQRVKCNYGLEYAIMKANELQKPLIAYFGVTDDFPEAHLWGKSPSFPLISVSMLSLKCRGVQSKSLTGAYGKSANLRQPS